MFLAGLTEIELWTLVVIALVGRAPTYVVADVSGASLADEDEEMALSWPLVLVVTTVWGLLNRERVAAFLGTR